MIVWNKTWNEFKSDFPWGLWSEHSVELHTKMFMGKGWNPPPVLELEKNLILLF